MKKLMLFIISFSLIACQKQSESSMGYGSGGNAKTSYAIAKETSQQSISDEYDQEAEQVDETVERQVIKTADYHFEVSDLDQSTMKISDIIKRHSGFISQSNQQSSPYRLTQHITIRVPAESFEELLANLETASIYTNHKRINSQDITEEFLDITTRLKTKKEVRDRYIDILRNKAETVEDILNAEEKIRVLQEEIEAREGRLKFLKNQVSLSTIHLEIYQQIPYSPQQVTYKKSFWQKSMGALSSGWELLLNLLLGLMQIWPLLLILLFAIWRRSWFFTLFRRKEK